MTSDDAFDAAARLLDERGQLLNAHLFRLVEGDADLFQEVRERLIRSGIAEDRSGVGLARAASAKLISAQSSFTQKTRSSAASSIGIVGQQNGIGSDDINSQESAFWSNAEWWLMTGGTTCGPMDLMTLCHMRQNGELFSSDVVRQGETGLWIQLDRIPLLAASKPPQGDQTLSSRLNARRTRLQKTAQQAVETIETSGGGTETAREFHRPGKSWTVDLKSRPNWWKHACLWIVGFVGGRRRIRILLASLAVIGGINYWWQQPPPAKDIYVEFVNCRKSLQRLQDRRVTNAEWASTTQRFRPRIQSLVNRIRSRATDRYPAEKELYNAGQLGLLPMLESTSIFVSTDQAFEKHIERASHVIEGKVSTP